MGRFLAEEAALAKFNPSQAGHNLLKETEVCSRGHDTFTRTILGHEPAHAEELWPSFVLHPLAPSPAELHT